jgi:hypothetical protein
LARLPVRAITRWRDYPLVEIPPRHPELVEGRALKNVAANEQWVTFSFDRHLAHV